MDHQVGALPLPEIEPGDQGEKEDQGAEGADGRAAAA
jgi:hypothetical protein